MASWKSHVRPLAWPAVWTGLALWLPWAVGVFRVWQHTGDAWPISEGLAGWFYFLGAPINGPYAVLIWTGRLNFIEGVPFLMTLLQGFDWLMEAPDSDFPPLPLLVSAALLVAGAVLGGKGKGWLVAVVVLVAAVQTWASLEAFELLT